MPNHILIVAINTWFICFAVIPLCLLMYTNFYMEVELARIVRPIRLGYYRSFLLLRLF